MFGVEYQGNLLISVSAKRIGLGLDGQMEYFLELYPKARLIIIDTLQKVRELSGDSYSYASDYDVIGQLKKFGERHNVAILIVHHTRKQPSEDSFEMISGTTGLLGCADGALLLHKEKRTDRKAILEVVGRDQPDQRLHLIRNEERLTWELDSVEQEPWREPPQSIDGTDYRHAFCRGTSLAGVCYPVGGSTGRAVFPQRYCPTAQCVCIPVGTVPQYPLRNTNAPATAAVSH